MPVFKSLRNSFQQGEKISTQGKGNISSSYDQQGKGLPSAVLSSLSETFKLWEQPCGNLFSFEDWV